MGRGEVEVVVRCCVCGAERSGRQWVRPPHPSLPGVSISHTYCPRCFEKAKSQLKATRPAGR